MGALLDTAAGRSKKCCIVKGGLAQADGIMKTREMLTALVPVPNRRTLKVRNTPGVVTPGGDFRWQASSVE